MTLSRTMKFARTGTRLLFGIALGGCAQEPAKTTLDTCTASVSMSEVDIPEQTVQVGGGAAIGQHIRPAGDMVVRRVMFRASTVGMTSLILTFYEIANYDSQAVAETPVASFNMSVTYSSAQVQSLWLTLPTPLTLKGGQMYLIGFAPNAAVNLQWGSRMLSVLRGDYRTGNGSGGPGGGALWGSTVDEKALSMGFEGESTCNDF